MNPLLEAEVAAAGNEEIDLSSEWDDAITVETDAPSPNCLWSKRRQ